MPRTLHGKHVDKDDDQADRQEIMADSLRINLDYSAKTPVQ
jgi:hypothetical protein